MADSLSAQVEPAVKLNDFERLWADAGSSILEAVRAVGESGWYVLGREVESFERDLCAYWGLSYAVGVASGLDALELGLRACGCGPGSKVLLPPVSAFATTLAVLKIGAIPVFADCDAYGLLDLNVAEDALAADPSIRFLLPVHLYGHCLDMRGLRHLADRFQVRIIEDCAQSIGSSHHGIRSGSCGDCAATSFYPTKNLGALGDGGALLTSSEDIAAHVRRLRDYGQCSKYVHSEIGYNSRLDELQAAILRRVFLPRLAWATEARRALASRYLSEISSPFVTPVGTPPGSDSCWHLFPVRVAPGRKKEFADHLKSKGIQSAEHYPIAMPDQPAMKGVQFREFRRCDRGRALCESELSLPIHPFLTASETARVIDGCNLWR